MSGRIKWRALVALCGISWASLTAAGTPQPDVPISPQGLHVVVNLPQTRLFLYQDGTLVKSYPVAVGKMLTKTPTGDFSITGVYRAPSWHVPKSIQEEMRRQGKPVQTVVPPGPQNPLGPVFIRFGEPRLGLGFHGTNAPGSVPGFRSHGCVRLKNEDALELAGTVYNGAAVTVAYQTVLLNEDDAGELWLTALRNPYKGEDPSYPMLADTLLNWQREKAVAVHGKRVDLALRERSGKPVCLTCTRSDGARINGQLTALRWLNPSVPVSPGLPDVPMDISAPIQQGTGSMAPARKPRPSAAAPASRPMATRAIGA
ncbi:L,D-transpeptidase [Gulbenkiania mobilis]|uniref:L,D-transpeptidase-like protein n=1 Tax=Gulbenkiania mobilis TaxID=397457 RepID=A0ABY2CUF9_GULMO|nr:L,D-transpeptidase-like protein [Gulbenkiania mobilis]